MRCEQVRRVILQQTLEGGFVPAAELADHLRGCPECHSLLLRVTEVDIALRALPLEQMPAWSVRQMIAQPAKTGQRQEPFLPWTLWLPVGSLLIGLLWSYFTLIWPTGPDVIRSFDPRLAIWLVQFEEWVIAQQAMLKVIALSVGAGLIFTVLAVSLGLYVGRDRVAAGHSH
jgi:predicted anti-sigma-YlaC factor YlaD